MEESVVLYARRGMSVLGGGRVVEGHVADGGEPNGFFLQCVRPKLRVLQAKVEPIFLAKRPGHARCVTCHTINHVPLHLVPLSPGSTTWNEEQ